jgi:hypothetical protein
VKITEHIFISLLWVLPPSCAGDHGKQVRQEQTAPALHQEVVSLIHELLQQAVEPRPKSYGEPNNDWRRRYDEHMKRQMQRRSEIITRLAAIGQLAMPALIEALDDDTRYGYVRRSAAEAIGKIGDAESIPTLHRLLREGNDSERRGTAEALGNLKSVDSVASLVASLEKDRDLQVRLLSAVALGRIGSKAAVAPLAERLAQNGENDNVRAYVAESLGRLGATAKIGAILSVFEESHRRSPAGILAGNCELALRAITGMDRASSSGSIPCYNRSHATREHLDSSVKAWHDWWEREGKFKYPQE